MRLCSVHMLVSAPAPALAPTLAPTPTPAAVVVVITPLTRHGCLIAFGSVGPFRKQLESSNVRCPWVAHLGMSTTHALHSAMPRCAHSFLHAAAEALTLLASVPLSLIGCLVRSPPYKSIPGM